MEDGNSSTNKGKSTMNVPIPPLPPNGDQGSSNPTRCGRPPIPPSSQSASSPDQLVPIANVTRIMRKILPPHAKISDEAKLVIQESVSEFISFITEEANQKCRQEHRKTITAEDLLYAMEKLGFDDYVGYLRLYVDKYREMEGLNNPRRQLLMYRPKPGTQHAYAGRLKPGPAVMMPNIMNPYNYNVGMIAPTGQTPNGLAYAPGGSSSPALPGAYFPDVPTNSDGSSSYSNLINQINFEGGSCIHDEVEFDPIELPGDVSPCGSSSANFIPGAENEDSFDPFAPFE